MRAVQTQRKQLAEIIDSRVSEALIAEAVVGPEALQAGALRAAEHGPTITLTEQSLWGIHVVELTHGRSAFAKATANIPSRTNSIAVEELTESYTQILDLILALTPQQLRLRRIANAIRQTNRKINALEQVLIPRLRREARFIAAALDERARDDTFRLKQLKRKKGRS